MGTKGGGGGEGGRERSRYSVLKVGGEEGGGGMGLGYCWEVLLDRLEETGFFFFLI